MSMNSALAALCLTAGCVWPQLGGGRSCSSLSDTWHRVPAYLHLLWHKWRLPSMVYNQEVKPLSYQLWEGFSTRKSNRGVHSDALNSVTLPSIS